MENAPIIRFGAIRPNLEVRERFDKWFDEVYYPEFIKARGVEAIDRYRILGESGDCPETMSIWYITSLKALLDFSKDPQRNILSKDVTATWINRYGGERVWDGTYRLIKSFGKGTLIVREGDEGLIVESSPIIHIEGLRISPGEEDKYAKWFSTTGSVVFMPLLARIPGLKRIDCLEYTGITIARTENSPRKVPEYPPYVSIFQFESLNAYKDYEKSLELAASREGLKTLFPNGLDYRWNVQYQLIRSWRK